MVVPVTVRRLQRETSAVLREVEKGQQPVVVTRDGEEVAKIVPLTAADRQWRRWVREAGGDPDDPSWRRSAEAQPLAASKGRSLTAHLAALREDER